MAAFGKLGKPGGGVAMFPRISMSPRIRRYLQLGADNLFWLFLALMIILGSTLETPMINVGLTAR